MAISPVVPPSSPKGKRYLTELLVPEQAWIHDSFSFKGKQEKSLFLDVSNLMWAKYNISDPVNAGLQADPEQAGSSTNSQFSFSLRHYAEKLMDPRVKSYFTPAQSQSISLTLFTLHWNRNLKWQDHYHQRKGNLSTGHQFAWYRRLEGLDGSKQREEARERAAKHGQFKDAITLIGFEGITERQPHI